MALDPSISLAAGKNLQSFDLGALMQKGLSIQQAQQALEKGRNELAVQPQQLQAELSQAQAVAEQQQATARQMSREEGTRLRLSALTKLHSKADTKTGKISIDHSAIAAEAAAEGMDPGTVFGFMDKASAAAQGQLKTSTEKREFAEKSYLTAANMARVQTDPAEAMRIITSARQTVAKAVGQEDADGIAAQFWNMDKLKTADGSPIDPTIAGQHIISQSAINAEASITPMQEREAGSKGIGRQQLDAGGQQAKDMRTFLKTRGITVPETMNISNMLLDPTIKKELDITQYAKQSGIDLGRYTAEQEVVPAGTKAGGIAAAEEAKVALSQVDDALTAGKNYTQKLGTKVGSLLQTGVWDRYVSQDRDAARIQSAVDLYNAKNPGANLSVPNMGLGPVLSRLQQQRATLATTVKAGTDVAKSKTFSGAAAKVETAVTPPASKEPSKGSTRIHAGKVYEYVGGFRGGEENFKNWKAR